MKERKEDAADIAEEISEEELIEEAAEPVNPHLVLVNFTDDDGTVYWVGEAYPKAGCRPTEERIEYLKSEDTAFGRPVIM